MVPEDARRMPAWYFSFTAQTVTGFELLGAASKISTPNKIRRALEGAGVQLIDEDEEGGPGVRLQKGKAAGKRK